MKNKKNLLKITALLVFFFGFFFISDFLIEKQTFRIYKNASESLPWRWFFGYPINKIENGMYVAAEHSCSKIVLIKKVVGVSGDTIKHFNSHIYVNEIDYGICLDVSPTGRKMTPISEGIIPEGYLFLHGTQDMLNLDW